MKSIPHNSLQRQSALKTFFSVLLAGVMTLIVSVYLHANPHAFALTGIPSLDIFIEYGLIVLVLVFFAILLSIRHFQALDKPLENLEKLTYALPMLASKKFDEAELVFDGIDKTTPLKEIGALHKVSIELSQILQDLDRSVEHRTNLLRSANDELRNERDFVKNLLDTAQLIILTIDENNQISLFNDHAESLTGFTEDEILGEDVGRFFPAGHWLEASAYFNELRSGNLSIAQQDAELIDKTGQIRHISWLHSRLENIGPEANLMCVGLDMTEKREAEKRIIWLAEHDPLTDLANRRKFLDEFEKSVQTAIRYKHNNAVLFFDLDHFKDINDTSGHKAGDDLLKLIASTLKRVTRFTDLVARLGGDEFAVIMPETDDLGAVTVAKKVLTELSKIKLEYGTVKHKVSCSIGIVNYPLHDANTTELLGFADLAMYKAKAAGKGTYHVFSPNDDTKQQLETRVYWKHQIEEALDNNHFILYYQPILHIENREIQHYEVLVRMRDPKSGEINLPAKFIQVAEEVGLIQNIDQYVLQMAIKKLAALQKTGHNIKFSINLSGAVVDTPVLLPFLKRIIKKYAVDPTGLIFEVTETAAVNNMQQARLMMTAIKALGCQFSLDDFGVGFASFNYMRELPIDIIKIDGIFIKDLDKNKDDQLFVKALIDVAKGLGRKTIAEFVENDAILSLLKEYGVDYAQGYFVGKPDAKLRKKRDWIAPSVDPTIQFVEQPTPVELEQK
jgi:diguanylate cyclase (GGDEF)-like protein/PAS domain S-box-containing protein